MRTVWQLWDYHAVRKSKLDMQRHREMSSQPFLFCPLHPSCQTWMRNHLGQSGLSRHHMEKKHGFRHMAFTRAVPAISSPSNDPSWALLKSRDEQSSLCLVQFLDLQIHEHTKMIAILSSKFKMICYAAIDDLHRRWLFIWGQENINLGYIL